MKKDLTVAICAYNCERYIGETLSCLMAQTYRDFELLVVNDCSTDNSRAVIEQFFTEHSFPHRIVDFEENRGLAGGRKYVEENVQTKYVLFDEAMITAHCHQISIGFNGGIKLLNKSRLWAIISIYK